MSAEPTPAVYAAIVNVMNDLSKEGISKDRKNQQQGYSFRGIEDMYNTLCGLLAKHKLCMLPRVTSVERTERETQKGGALFVTYITCEYDLVSAVDGSKHTVCVIGEAMDSADKSSNKSMSAANKYAAVQAFLIPTEGDNDADATTHAPIPRSQQQRREPDHRREAAPPPAAAPAQSKPLPTVTSKNYPLKQYADVPFKSMPASELAKYIAHYTDKLPSLDQPNHRSAAMATIEAAKRELEHRRQEETKSGAAGDSP